MQSDVPSGREVVAEIGPARRNHDVERGRYVAANLGTLSPLPPRGVAAAASTPATVESVDLSGGCRVGSIEGSARLQL
eukprot:1022139-Pleurochrysis_carterae.AAC.2